MTVPTQEVENQKEAREHFEKSRASIYDLLKLLATLATGGVAGYFLLLTQSIQPPISSDQLVIAYAGFVCMGIAVLFGLGGWAADARYYDRWAESLEREESKGRLWEQRNFANRARNFALVVAVAAFLVAVVLSGAFAFKRSATLSGFNACSACDPAATPAPK